jgi:hypothetical protein
MKRRRRRAALSSLSPATRILRGADPTSRQIPDGSLGWPAPAAAGEVAAATAALHSRSLECCSPPSVSGCSCRIQMFLSETRCWCMLRRTFRHRCRLVAAPRVHLEARKRSRKPRNHCPKARRTGCQSSVVPVRVLCSICARRAPRPLRSLRQRCRCFRRSRYLDTGPWRSPYTVRSIRLGVAMRSPPHRTPSQRKRTWSGRRDSNSRPLAPHASALPGCATPRLADDCTVRVNRIRVASAQGRAAAARVKFALARQASRFSKARISCNRARMAPLVSATAGARSGALAPAVSSRLRAPLIVNPCSYSSERIRRISRTS